MDNPAITSLCYHLHCYFKKLASPRNLPSNKNAERATVQQYLRQHANSAVFKHLRHGTPSTPKHKKVKYASPSASVQRPSDAGAHRREKSGPCLYQCTYRNTR